MNPIALCLWMLSVLFPAWRISRARRLLDDDGLLRVVRAADSPLATLFPILLFGAIGYALIRVAPPGQRAAIVVAIPVLALLGSARLLHHGYRRMRASGVPAAYLAEWRLAQWVSAVLFLAGSAFAFAPQIAALTGLSVR